MKKRIVATFTIENDLQELKLVSHLDSLGARVSINPYNEHFENNKEYKRLKKAKKDAENAYYNFLNKQ
jgi:hypothetical protein